MKTTYKVAFGLLSMIATAAAQGIGPIPNLSITPVNDAEMTVGKTAQGFYFDHRTSNGTSYSQDCNPYFTVDISLPGSYNVPQIGNAILIAAGFDQGAQLTEANCDSASESLLIYKRTSVLAGVWTNWKLVNSQYVKGTWVPFVDMGIPPYCALSVPLRVVAPAQPWVLDQYRVKVLPKFFGAPVQARVDWEWTY